MDAPLDVCEERDVRGLYKKARKGVIKSKITEQTISVIYAV